MKKIITSILCVLGGMAIVGSASAQSDTTSNWKKGGTVSLNLTQVALSNWASGGENSISAVGFLNLFANYKKGNSTWDNTLDIGYGQIKQGDRNWIKSDDRIELNSKYGYKATKSFYYSALYNLKTQSAPGYQAAPADSVKISNFLAPAYNIISIGLDYKPSDTFSLYFSPVTGKITIVNDQTLADAGAFGVSGAEYDNLGNLVTAGQKMRFEFGAYLQMKYKRDIMENVTLAAKLDLFSNYLNNPGNIDINGEAILTMKINKFLSANVSVTAIYDDDITITEDKNNNGIIEVGESGPRLQIKEVLGVGLSYKF